MVSDVKAPSSIIDLYNDYIEDIAGRTLPPDREMVLLRYKGEDETERASLRMMLKDVRVSVM